MGFTLKQTSTDLRIVDTLKRLITYFARCCDMSNDKNACRKNLFKTKTINSTEYRMNTKILNIINGSVFQSYLQGLEIPSKYFGR